MELAEARQHVIKRWLVDRCEIRSPADPVYDDEQGVDVPGVGDLVYSGPCRHRPAGGDRVVEAGDAPVSLGRFDHWLPWDTTGIKVNQIVTMTKSRSPHIVGRSYRVADVLGGSDAEALKLSVEDVLSIDEGEEAGS